MENIVLSSVPVDELMDLIRAAVRSEFNANQTSPDDEEEIMTRRQAAAYLGVSLTTINGWVKNGKLPGYRIGCNIRFKKSEVENSLKKIRA